MSLSINSKTYTADSFKADLVGYIGTGKTLSIRDDVVLRRTAPKPTSVFSGVGRTTAKVVRTLALTDALTPTGDGSVEINVVLPVGVAGADVDALLNDFGAFLASATFKTHAKTQQVSF